MDIDRDIRFKAAGSNAHDQIFSYISHFLRIALWWVLTFPPILGYFWYIDLNCEICNHYCGCIIRIIHAWFLLHERVFWLKYYSEHFIILCGISNIILVRYLRVEVYNEFHFIGIGLMIVIYFPLASLIYQYSVECFNPAYNYHFTNQIHNENTNCYDLGWWGESNTKD